jgi:hypothetical protein
LAARVIGVLIGCYAIFMLVVTWRSNDSMVQILATSFFIGLLLLMAAGTVLAVRRARLALSIVLVGDVCMTAITVMFIARDCGASCGSPLAGVIMQSVTMLVAAWIIYPGRVGKITR